LLAIRAIDGEEFGSDDISAILIKVDVRTQPRNEGTYDTLEALEVIDRTKGPDERTMHGQCAGRTCPMKMMVALLDELRIAQRWRVEEKVSIREEGKNSRD
jgi:hypothetical protein